MYNTSNLYDELDKQREKKENQEPPTYNTSNLYDEMDKQREKKETQELHELTRKKKYWRIFGYIKEYILIILVIIGIGAFMSWKHDGQALQGLKDYWENFDNPNYVNRGKEPANQKRDIIVEGTLNNQTTTVPVLDIQGDLTRNGETHIIIKHNGKEYTVKIGDSFANGKYIITNISQEEMEITDAKGNYFHYIIPNRQHIKK